MARAGWTTSAWEGAGHATARRLDSSARVCLPWTKDDTVLDGSRSRRASGPAALWSRPPPLSSLDATPCARQTVDLDAACLSA